MQILLLGDTMLGENLFHLNRGIVSNYKNNYKEIISGSVRNILFNDCDVILLNMEYSLVDCSDLCRLNPSSRVYRGSIDSLSFIHSEKTKIFNIANNHFSQHGINSSRYTKNNLCENGINYIGDLKDPYKIVKGNKKYNFWGYSTIKDPFFCKEYNYLPLEKLELINNGVIKEANDFWAVSIHWGDEYIGYPSQAQRNIAYKLIDNGFDLIIGHHPHVIQPIEKYKDKLIIYSLGNFIFDHNFSEETTISLSVLIDTDHLEKSRFYKTKQIDYKVVYATEINLSSLTPKLKDLNGDYNLVLKNIQKNFIRKRKIEYLKNIHTTDIRVIPHIIRKKIRKHFL